MLATTCAPFVVRPLMPYGALSAEARYTRVEHYPERAEATLTFPGGTRQTRGMASVTRTTRAPRTGFLSSPRNQRRLLIGSGVVLVAGIIAFVSAVVLRGTGNAFTDTFSNKPAYVYHAPKHVPLSKDEISVAREFMATAVTRKDLDAAYNIVHPDLKGTLTRKQWDTGNIPVVDYPAENVKTAAFQVEYSYRTSALLQVNLVAKPHASVRPELNFFIGLKRAGGSPTGRWLVSYWEPRWRPPIPEKLN